MEYTGEHLAIGMTGRACIAIAFASGLLALISYLIASHRKAARQGPYMRLGRQAFRVHSVALLGIIACLLTIVIQGYYEYHYAWKHVSNDLPLQYVFSAFWEGQEGSFLLWGFWQIVLGNILIFSVKEWEAPVMSVMATIQVFILSMVLGVYFFGHKVGSDPFLLIRELPDYLSTKLPKDYLQAYPQFQDGQGLAPLLRNYWMTIHPPTLFLGFASTSIPFAYAIAGLWRRDLVGWLRPAIPWSFFGIGILGAGVLMGGAWAYEALSFGGFWAWDPVENASLVPWILLLGAGHLMIVNKKRQSSLFTTFLLTLSAFILVLYSTFLTRSGILGDSSVHSFTEDGMFAHLLLFLLFFIGVSVFFLLEKRGDRRSFIVASLLFLGAPLFFAAHTLAVVLFLLLSITFTIIAYFRSFHTSDEEENLWSREFWLFLASLILLLSAVQISFSTSIPVLNHLLSPFSGFFQTLHGTTGWSFFETLAKKDLAPPSDANPHYNSWQIVFAFLICLLAAIGQFLRYGRTRIRTFFKRIGWSALASLLVAGALYALYGRSWAEIYLQPGSEYEAGFYPGLILLLFASVFVVLANGDHWIRMLRGRFDQGGASLAHIGFGLLILGALISQSRSEKISVNRSGLDIKRLSEDFKNDKDMLLFKGDTVQMGEHFVSYREKERGRVRVDYRLEFFETRDRYYQKGDIVVYQGGMFRAKNEHLASDRFLNDRSQHWERLPDPSQTLTEKAEPWKNAKVGEKRFELNPSIQLNEEMGNVPEPDTRHFITKDIYTHVRWAELKEKEEEKSQGEYKEQEHTVEHGDTIPSSSAIVRFMGLEKVDSIDRKKLKGNDIAAKGKIEVRTVEGEERIAEPLYIIRDSSYRIPHQDSVPEAGLRFSIKRIHPQEGKIDLVVEEKQGDSKEFIVLQAIEFPLINVLWTGCILMTLGSFLAVRNRIREKRKKKDDGQKEAERRGAEEATGTEKPTV